jgi:hypothetical protein
MATDADDFSPTTACEECGGRHPYLIYKTRPGYVVWYCCTTCLEKSEGQGVLQLVGGSNVLPNQTP